MSDVDFEEEEEPQEVEREEAPAAAPAPAPEPEPEPEPDIDPIVVTAENPYFILMGGLVYDLPAAKCVVEPLEAFPVSASENGDPAGAVMKNIVMNAQQAKDAKNSPLMKGFIDGDRDHRHIGVWKTSAKDGGRYIAGYRMYSADETNAAKVAQDKLHVRPLTRAWVNHVVKKEAFLASVKALTEGSEEDKARAAAINLHLIDPACNIRPGGDSVRYLEPHGPEQKEVLTSLLSKPRAKKPAPAAKPKGRKRKKDAEADAGGEVEVVETGNRAQQANATALAQRRVAGDGTVSALTMEDLGLSGYNHIEKHTFLALQESRDAIVAERTRLEERAKTDLLSYNALVKTSEEDEQTIKKLKAEKAELAKELAQTKALLAKKGSPAKGLPPSKPKASRA